MKLPKYLTTVTPFSKKLALLIFILFPILGFRLGMVYKKNLDVSTLNDKSENMQYLANTPTPTLFPIPTSSKQGWETYVDQNVEYSMEYPHNYILNHEEGTEVLFEKKVEYPHRTNNFIFIQKGESTSLSAEKIANLKNMVVGEKKVVVKNNSPLMDQFNTYERLPDVEIDNKKMKAFLNQRPFEFIEGTNYYLYMYEGASDYFFGGLTNENSDVEDNISFSELKEMIATIRFLE